MEEIKGVLFGTGQFDWFASGNSSITHDIVVDDWKDYKIEHEIQWTGTYDTLFCVTYSALDVIGSLFMYYLSHNLISPENVLWLKDNGYFKNGFINFNERFSAINGETSNNGAYQYKVANGIKNYGLIPQDLFPLADNFKDNIDKKFITEKMYELGKEFLKRFSINYEWVTDLKESIKSSPVQLIVKFANYENPNDILEPKGEPNHAVKCVYICDEYHEIDDTYWQQYKRYHPDYTFSPMAFKLTSNNTTMTPQEVTQFLKTNDKKWVRNSQTGSFGRILQGKLFTFETKDRAALALLDDRVRTNGVQITNDIWFALPKTNF